MPFFSNKCTASFVPSAFLTEVPYYWPLDTWLSTGYFYSSYNAIPMFSHQLQTQNDLYTAPPTEVPCYRLPDTWSDTNYFYLFYNLILMFTYHKRIHRVFRAFDVLLRKFPVTNCRSLDWISVTSTFPIIQLQCFYPIQTHNVLYTAPPTEVPCYRLPDTWLNTSCFLLSVTWFQYFCINLGHITSFAPMVFPTRSLFQQPVTWSNGRCLRKFHAIDCQALIGYRFLSPFPKDDSGIHRLLPDF